MSATELIRNPEHSDWQQTVALLEQCLQQLQSLAPVESIDELRRLLPPHWNEGHRLVLIELIKFDLAAAAQLGMERRLEDYLREFARELPPEAVPADLILEELHVWGAFASGPDINDYVGRFPHAAELIKNWHAIQSHATMQQLGVSFGAAPEFEIGGKVEDFRILRCVGRGAFATVYLSLQETLQRLVALKVSQRSSDEPITLSQLDHPNIVRVYDQRNLAQPPVRLLYMQFVGGGTLSACLHHVSPLPIEFRCGQHIWESIVNHLKTCGLEPPGQHEFQVAISAFTWPMAVAWVGQQLAEGLDYAHRRGVIHRDIKPANILFAADGTPRLADFNVSFSGVAGRAGAAAYFGGSLAYMSPEQLEVAGAHNSRRDAADLDGRSDLFSLGIVLWEMLYGARPWTKGKVPGSWSEALDEEWTTRRLPFCERPISESIAQDPSFRVLDRTIRQCLAVDREDRPATGAEVAEAFRVALHPPAASRLYPPSSTLVRNLVRWPAWLVLVCGALVPNLIAAVFNFLYNSSQIVHQYPDLWPTFLRVSAWVNGLFFPLGVGWGTALIVSHSQRLRRLGFGNDPPTSWAAGDWDLGHRIALISGALWLLAGLVFPSVLWASYRSFRWDDALHFFSSLTICGGVAMVYPFFWINWVNLRLYFPPVLARRISDVSLWESSETLRRRVRTYLTIAAAIPLVALLLLAISVDIPRHYLLVTIVTTAVGFFASIAAVQFIDGFFQDLEPIARRATVTRQSAPTTAKTSTPLQSGTA